jgi:Zn-dependent M28 family amino/carboxypeptidase
MAPNVRPPSLVPLLHGAAAMRTIGIEETTARLKRDISVLADQIGERNLRDPQRRRALEAARDYIAAEFAATCSAVHRQSYVVQKARVENLEIEFPGTDKADEIVVVGAHYDTAANTPGANDNASGVAALLAVARDAARRVGRRRTVRLVAFCTEEPPFTRTPDMGSWVYARACRRRGDAVVGMLSLEMLGCYDDSHRPEHAPFPFNYASPWRADFLAVVGDLASRELVTRIADVFERAGQVRCIGAALPGFLPGVRSSDHWSFWKEGYRAAMLTDTAWLRYRHYHRPSDTPDKLDYGRLGKVTSVVARALDQLADTDSAASVASADRGACTMHASRL